APLALKEDTPAMRRVLFILFTSLLFTLLACGVDVPGGDFPLWTRQRRISLQPLAQENASVCFWGER
ncbi:MAG: hypothetical protein ACE5JA_10805, partial [bacterium]